MDFYEAQEFFQKMHPDKQITYQFDDSCRRVQEVIYTDGAPNLVHHVEHNKVRVNVEGQDPVYVPISPHRINFTWSATKQILDSLIKSEDVYIHAQELECACKLSEKEYDDKIQELCSYSGLSKEKIEAKIEKHKQNT